MKKPDHYTCCRCDEEMYGGSKLFDLKDHGVGMVCEECFIEYVKDNKLLSENVLDEDGWSGELLAEHLDVEYTYVDSHIENEWYLMLEEKERERRDLF